MLDLKVIDAELKRLGYDVPETDSGLTGEQIAAAVAHDPAADAYVYLSSDTPRCRFINSNDRGEIRNVRQRLHPIYLENQVYQGNENSYERSKRCGQLKASQCNDCGAVQSEASRDRRTCKQRICPRCAGAQARKPLWAKQELLEECGKLCIYTVNLGSYDIGGEDELIQWPTRARDVVSQVYTWDKRLARRKDAPGPVVDSFSAVRADLHQGHLTLNITYIGPADSGTAAYLRDYFTQATEREVTVKVTPCSDAQDAIDTFGNLMSSPAIYNTVDECQALMVAFKGRRMVQPRGRFYKVAEAQPNEDEAAGTTSRGHGGGGDLKLEPCHACGGVTHPLGMVGGDWRKERGGHSGKLYWRLKDPPEREVLRG